MMSNMKRAQRTIAFAATLISISAIPTAAFAGDNKVYPGSLCQIETTPNNPQFSRAAGQFLVVGTSPISVHCPAVRDVTGSTENGSTGPLALVHVFSNNSKATTIECDLRANPVNGLNFKSQRLTISLSGGAPGASKKHMFNFTGPVPQTPNGPYEIACFLQPGTGVASYSIAE